MFLLLVHVAEAQPTTEGRAAGSEETLADSEDEASVAAPDEATETPAPSAVEVAQEDEAAAALKEEQERVEALEKRLAALEQAEAKRAEEAELQALLEQEEHVAELPETQPLKMYGFMDFGFQKAFLSENSYLYNIFPTRASTFVLGNLNVFIDAEPHENWRGLMELRFTQLPHGVEQFPNPTTGATYERENAQVVDFTSPSFRSYVTVGSVIIERAWMQWTGNDYFKVRSGLFLTPFGIWNVDHGTPTLISLVLPSAIADLNFPYQQDESVGQLAGGAEVSRCRRDDGAIGERL
jgi:hypothetical protein